ncbi:hypothetical protein V2A05_34125, partial [Pseudomonas aeruginosa]
GEIGKTEAHDQVSSGSKQEVVVELGLLLISIRLQKQLVNDLKNIAEYHGVGFLGIFWFLVFWFSVFLI